MSRFALPLLTVPSLLLPSVAVARDFDNALLIVIDDLGVDKVGAYGADVDNPDEERPATPTLDTIAAAGVRFTDAWASPVCSPSRASLYAGAFPYRTGIGTVITEGSSKKLSNTPATLAKLAADGGMKTALFGKWHVGETSQTLDAPGTVANYKEYPVQVGFQYFAGSMDAELDSYTDWLYTVSAPVGTTRQYTTTAVDSTANATDQTTADALSWMAANASRRRLSVVSYNLAHATHTGSSTRSWADPAESCGAVAGTETENHRVSVECVDEAIGELLAGTPDLGNTLVIVVGDNGTPDEVGEGAFADGRGKGTVYESGIRVPLMVADGAALQSALDNGGSVEGGAYKLSVGEVEVAPANIVDIYATVADFLSLSSSACTVGATCGLDSLSMRSVATGGSAVRTSNWSELYSRNGSTYVGWAALRSGAFKLVVATDEAGTCRAYEMYDLEADRWEEDDRYGDAIYAEEQADLLALLAEQEAKMTYRWIATPVCSE